jgi:hypothetical protein
VAAAAVAAPAVAVTAVAAAVAAPAVAVTAVAAAVTVVALGLAANTATGGSCDSLGLCDSLLAGLESSTFTECSSGTIIVCWWSFVVFFASASASAPASGAECLFCVVWGCLD